MVEEMEGHGPVMINVSKAKVVRQPTGTSSAVMGDWGRRGCR